MGYHAKLSPSSSHRWSECTASINAQEGRPNESSPAAREGTCCHQIGAECLMRGTPDAQDYLGKRMLFWVHAESDSNGEDWAEIFEKNEGAHWEECDFIAEQLVSQEMCDAVDTYLLFVRQQVADTNSTLLVEQSVPIGHITGERDPNKLDNEGKPNAFGSSDAVLVPAHSQAERVLIVDDAKFGRKKVMAYEFISPESIDLSTGEIIPPQTRMNRQLAMYALGTYHAWNFMYDFTHVKVCIVQPFLEHVSEYTCTVEELLALGEWLKGRAELTRTNPVFAPSPETCHFCRASGDCPAQTAAAWELATEGFENVDNAVVKKVSATDNKLGSYYARLPLLEEYATAVRKLVAAEVNQGRPVMRNDGMFYKLVPGRNTARQWKNHEEAEALMKSFRLRQEQMYDSKLISPTTAETLSKKKRKGPEPVIGQTQWKRLNELISQSPGNPVIALATDPRPALPSGSEGFGEVNLSGDVSDLF